MTEKINPISILDFDKKVKVSDSIQKLDFLKYFQEYIQMAPSFASGPHFWFIPDNSTLTIVAVSPNIGQLTPFAEDKWLKQNPDFFANLFHEDDRFYVLSSIQIAIETVQKLSEGERKNIKVNIYGRLANAKMHYRWVMIQIPAFYVSANAEVLSGLILITDMSHLNFGASPMMTILHYGKNHTQNFIVTNSKPKLYHENLPNITHREKELIGLMTRGLNTPQIAETLCLSYHTVENHKRNLRKKTNTKTSAELIDYVWRNNLI